MKDPLQPGVYAAVLTPLRDDLTIDLEELSSHCFDLLSRGCQGIALFGTTGEGASLSVETKIDALEKLLSKKFDPQKVIVANGSANVTDTVNLTQSALKKGCQTLLASPPSFYKNIKEEGVIAYYREIIQRVNNPDLRLLLYHIPQNSGVPITLKIIETLLREFPSTVIGLKESEGNPEFARAIITQFPNFQVFVGNELQMIETVKTGGSGAICGLANLYPELISSLYKEPRKELIEQLKSIFSALKGVTFIPAAKAFLAQRKGSTWKKVYPPLVSLNPKEEEAFFASLVEVEKC
jgi:4-hydroxy-tetrahydrodipicolinate synthase